MRKIIATLAVTGLAFAVNAARAPLIFNCSSTDGWFGVRTEIQGTASTVTFTIRTAAPATMAQGLPTELRLSIDRDETVFPLPQDGRVVVPASIFFGARSVHYRVYGTIPGSAALVKLMGQGFDF